MQDFTVPVSVPHLLDNQLEYVKALQDYLRTLDLTEHEKVNTYLELLDKSIEIYHNLFDVITIELEDALGVQE